MIKDEMQKETKLWYVKWVSVLLKSGKSCSELSRKLITQNILNYLLKKLFRAVMKINYSEDFWIICWKNMDQGIQEWNKYNLWKTTFKKFEMIWSALADHITSNFLKTVSHKFYLSIFGHLHPYFLGNSFLLKWRRTPSHMVSLDEIGINWVVIFTENPCTMTFITKVARSTNFDDV